MKKFLAPLLLMLTVCCLLSCKKEQRPPSLDGTWEIRQETTSTFNHTFLPGNDTLIRFSGNRFEELQKGRIVGSGTIRTFREDYPRTRESGNRIIFDYKSSSGKDFYTIAGTRLTINHGTDMQDGAVVIYERIR